MLLTYFLVKLVKIIFLREREHARMHKWVRGRERERIPEGAEGGVVSREKRGSPEGGLVFLPKEGLMWWKLCFKKQLFRAFGNGPKDKKQMKKASIQENLWKFRKKNESVVSEPTLLPSSPFLQLSSWKLKPRLLQLRAQGSYLGAGHQCFLFSPQCLTAKAKFLGKYDQEGRDSLFPPNSHSWNGGSTIEVAHWELWGPYDSFLDSWISGSPPGEASWEEPRLLPPNKCSAPRVRVSFKDACHYLYSQPQRPASEIIAYGKKQVIKQIAPNLSSQKTWLHLQQSI